MNNLWKIFEHYVHLDGWHVFKDQSPSVLIKVQCVNLHLVEASSGQLELDRLIKLEEVKDLFPQCLLLWHGPRERGYSLAFLDEAIQRVEFFFRDTFEGLESPKTSQELLQ